MSGKTYIGSGSDIAQQVKAIYVGDSNNTARKVKRAYIGDPNGTARRIFPESFLPSGYQQVEYIEGTGTQYINTGVSQNNTTTALEVTFAFTKTSYTSYATVAGHYATNKRFYIWSSQDSNYVTMGIGTGTVSVAIDKNKHTYKIDMHNLKAYHDGVSKAASSGSYSKTANNYNIRIFANANTSYPIRAEGKLYSAKIWNSNTLTHDYYPCRRLSDNKPGLYDIVTDTFLTNAGTGEFILGPDIDQKL